MLQQTQVRVVLPYFKKWIMTLPSLKALASADLDLVMKLWEGLGYYSRARSLKKGAEYVIKNFNGELPQTREELLSIPGIGPYTASAILSFAFHQRAVALDGNVARVLSRYYADEGDITKQQTRQRLEKRGDELLDDLEPWVSAEALIELGALVCTKSQPKCLLCPLSSGCKARAKGEVERYPVRPPRAKPTLLQRVVLVVHFKGKYLIVQRGQKAVMEGLFEFPYYPVEGSIEETLEPLLGSWDVTTHKPLSVQAHGFTRYRAELFPYFVDVKSCRDTHRDGLWLTLDELHQRPFSSGHKRILQEVTQFARVTI
jgi:A/G-specific adenine glycosylase